MRKLIPANLSLFLSMAFFQAYACSNQEITPLRLNCDCEGVRFYSCEPQRNEIGGGFALGAGLLKLNLRPVSEFMENDIDREFDLDENQLLLAGLSAYGGKRTGGRAGGQVWFGYKRFYGAMPDGESYSSLDVFVSYGGVFAEKSASTGDLTLLIGGLFGGGAFALRKAPNFSMGKYNFMDEGWVHYPEDGAEWAATPIFAVDGHGGINYSILSWMSLGLDAQMVFLYSPTGFGFGQKAFWTQNPGIRMRLVFGNI